MIGIICAMSIEAEIILSSITDNLTEYISGIKFVSGKIGNNDVVVAVSGIGKVNSAVCTQTMILKYSPEYIVNLGIAGGLRSDMHLFDTVIADKIVQHDIDTTAVGDELGLIPGINRIFIDCNPEISDSLSIYSEKLTGTMCKRGIIASGDQFVNKRKRTNQIVEQFGAIACDMESGSIGQVCFLNRTPFVIIRTISDNADGESTIDYSEISKRAASLAAETLISYISSF